MQKNYANNFLFLIMNPLWLSFLRFVGFYILFKFTNESCPENHKERYYEIANYTMPVKFLHLVCLAYVFSDWKIIKDFESFGFFNRKGLDKYIMDFMDVKNFY